MRRRARHGPQRVGAQVAAARQPPQQGAASTARWTQGRARAADSAPRRAARPQHARWSTPWRFGEQEDDPRAPRTRQAGHAAPGSAQGRCTGGDGVEHVHQEAAKGVPARRCREAAGEERGRGQRGVRRRHGSWRTDERPETADRERGTLRRPGGVPPGRGRTRPPSRHAPACRGGRRRTARARRARPRYRGGDGGTRLAPASSTARRGATARAGARRARRCAGGATACRGQRRGARW